MTRDQIEKLEALKWPPLSVIKESEYLARLPWTTVPLDEYALIQAAFPRLLEERKRLLEAAWSVIFASDGCRGHRDCNHSLTPWKDMRAAIAFAEEAAR